MKTKIFYTRIRVFDNINTKYYSMKIENENYYFSEEIGTLFEDGTIIHKDYSLYKITDITTGMMVCSASKRKDCIEAYYKIRDKYLALKNTDYYLGLATIMQQFLYRNRLSVRDYKKGGEK